MAPRVHPFISGSVLGLINKSMQNAGVPIELDVTLFGAGPTFSKQA